MNEKVNADRPAHYYPRVTPDPFADRLRAADLDRYLATLYAPAPARPALFALHALDLELAEVVRTTSESMVGLIRLAWWREALDRLDSRPPPAQPLLEALAERLLPLGVTGAMLAELETGFVALIEKPLDARGHIEARGGTLFALASRISGAEPESAKVTGRLWALGELRRTRPDIDQGLLRDVLAAPLGGPPHLRALAALARRDLLGEPGRRGAPSRQARMLWSILRG